MCAHYNGANVTFLGFNGRRVWRRLCKNDISVLMGVPSMYAHLLQVYARMDEDKQADCRAAATALRLAVCGSAACPLQTMQGWHDITGEVWYCTAAMCFKGTGCDR